MSSFRLNLLLIAILPILVISCNEPSNAKDHFEHVQTDSIPSVVDSIAIPKMDSITDTLQTENFTLLDRSQWTLDNYISIYPTGQKTEIENYINWLITSWDSVPNPIIAIYRGNDFGDYFHITFEDEHGNYYDFGDGANHFGEYPLFDNADDYADNPYYLNKLFKIHWDWKLANFPCCDGNYSETEAFLPSIIQLEVLEPTHLFSMEDKHLKWLVNNYKDELIEETSTIQLNDPKNLILNQHHFKTKTSETSVHIVICKNQVDALTIAEMNQENKTLDTTVYAVNGNVLSILSGKSPYIVNDLASWFSGEE